MLFVCCCDMVVCRTYVYRSHRTRGVRRDHPMSPLGVLFRTARTTILLSKFRASTHIVMDAPPPSMVGVESGYYVVPGTADEEDTNMFYA